MGNVAVRGVASVVAGCVGVATPVGVRSVGGPGSAGGPGSVGAGIGPGNVAVGLVAWTVRGVLMGIEGAVGAGI